MTWEYDRLGNRLKQNVIAGNTTGTDIGQPQFNVDVNTNHITNTGFHYDAAEHGGNLIADGTNTYTYDGANRMKHLSNGSGNADYTYFGALRIKKVVGSTTTVYVYSGSKPLVEYTGGDTREYIYSGSGLLATISTTHSGNTTTITTTYHHPDHLSNRAETDTSGAVVRTFGHAPFGEKWYETGTADKSKIHNVRTGCRIRIRLCSVPIFGVKTGTLCKRRFDEWLPGRTTITESIFIRIK